MFDMNVIRIAMSDIPKANPIQINKVSSQRMYPKPGAGVKLVPPQHGNDIQYETTDPNRMGISATNIVVK
jgi:hypothetical protein